MANADTTSRIAFTAGCSQRPGSSPAALPSIDHPISLHRVVVGDIDAVNQADLVDVGRNFRVVDGLERGHDLVGEPGDLGLRQRGRLSGGRGLRALGGLFNGGRVVTHAKNSRALTMDSASVSTSSFVL